MAEQCDNTSVGVIIRDPAGNFLLLTRSKFPAGIAPSAGHIDSHGSPEQAAIDEVREELGLAIGHAALRPTAIQKQRVSNSCRRLGGDHHVWWVYEASEYSGTLHPDANETKDARWYAPAEIRALAERTEHYQSGRITDDAWLATPGLEPVWYDFMLQLGLITR